MHHKYDLNVVVLSERKAPGEWVKATAMSSNYHQAQQAANAW